VRVLKIDYPHRNPRVAFDRRESLPEPYRTRQLVNTVRGLRLPCLPVVTCCCAGQPLRDASGGWRIQWLGDARPTCPSLHLPSCFPPMSPSHHCSQRFKVNSSSLSVLSFPALKHGQHVRPYWTEQRAMTRCSDLEHGLAKY
jgi:hypothetical protein